jgi:hypothetical protein
MRRESMDSPMFPVAVPVIFFEALPASKSGTRVPSDRIISLM